MSFQVWTLNDAYVTYLIISAQKDADIVLVYMPYFVLIDTPFIDERSLGYFYLEFYKQLPWTILTIILHNNEAALK